MICRWSFPLKIHACYARELGVLLAFFPVHRTSVVHHKWPKVGPASLVASTIRRQDSQVEIFYHEHCCASEVSVGMARMITSSRWSRSKSKGACCIQNELWEGWSTQVWSPKKLQRCYWWSNGSSWKIMRAIYWFQRGLSISAKNACHKMHLSNWHQGFKKWTVGFDCTKISNVDLEVFQKFDSVKQRPSLPLMNMTRLQRLRFNQLALSERRKRHAKYSAESREKMLMKVQREHTKKKGKKRLPLWARPIWSGKRRCDQWLVEEKEVSCRQLKMRIAMNSSLQYLLLTFFFITCHLECIRPGKAWIQLDSWS